MFRGNEHAWRNFHGYELAYIRRRGDSSLIQTLESETVKYGLEFQGTRTRERLRWQGPAAYTKDTRPLVREGAPQKQDRKCQTVKNIWSWAPDEGSTPRLTDWLAVSRNVTLTLTWAPHKNKTVTVKQQ
jgi:hypothetical protein